MSFLKRLFGKESKPKVKLATVDYNSYFQVMEFDGTPLEFLPLGMLSIPTGEIITCDPLVSLYNYPPLTRKVNPGSYPVKVCVAKTKESGDRYAIAKLEFSAGVATRWELATTDGQNVETLKEGEFFGFPVGAGLACFADAHTRQLYNEFDDDFTKQHPGGNLYDDLLAAEFKKNAFDQNNPSDAGDWVNFYLPNKPDLNIIMFQSGFGDGVYPAYWGINDTGEIFSLIIDFGVL